MESKLKIISLIAYSLIFLMGQMIGLPLIIWLIFTSFDFGNIDQVFAICGLAGIILNFTKHRSSRMFRILSFILMIAPIIKRLTSVPIEEFNYLTFQLPLLIFVIAYLTLIIKTKRNRETAYNNI